MERGIKTLGRTLWGDQALRKINEAQNPQNVGEKGESLGLKRKLSECRRHLLERQMRSLSTQTCLWTSQVSPAPQHTWNAGVRPHMCIDMCIYSGTLYASYVWYLHRDVCSYPSYMYCMLMCDMCFMQVCIAIHTCVCILHMWVLQTGEPGTTGVNAALIP